MNISIEKSSFRFIILKYFQNGLLLMFLIIIMGFSAKAENDTDEIDVEAVEEQQISLGDIVVTGTRLPSSSERIPGRVEVIDSQEISEMPFERADDIVNRISGVTSNNTTGLFARSPYVTMRGLGGNEPGRTLVLVDGVPANTGDTGAFRWNRLQKDNIERIEVFKGPGSSIYGSNAMGGVINIITKNPEEGFTGKTSAGYGTFNTKTVSGRVGYRSDGETGWYAQVSGTGTQSDGYYIYLEGHDNYDDRHKRFVEEYIIDTKLGYVFDSRNSLEVSYMYFDDKRGEGVKYNLKDGVYREHDTNAVSLRYNGGYGEWIWNAAVFYQKEDYYWERDNSDEQRMFRVNSDRIEYGTSAAVGREIGGINNLTLGVDTRFSEVDAIDDYINNDDYAVNKGKLDQMAVFAQNELRLLNETLILTAGLRFDHARFHDGRYDSNITGGFDLTQFSGSIPSNSWYAFSPRAAARYFFTPDYSVYGSYSRGFRAPMLDSLCRTGIMRGRFERMNPYLENEIVDTFEAGMNAAPLEGLDVAVSGFYSLGSDFIYVVDTGEELDGRDIYERKNVSDVLIYGVELDVQYKINKMFKIFSSYTWNGSEIKKFPDRKDLEGKTLEYVPEYQLDMGLTVLHSMLNGSIMFNRSGRQYADDANTEKVEAYHIVNLKLWSEPAILPGCRINLTVNDLLDERDRRQDDTRGPGRYVLGEVSYEW